MPGPRPSLLLALGSLVLAFAIENDGPAGTEDYFWPKRGGTYIGHGAVPFHVPTDFSKEPAWTWDNPDDELFRHGPVLDGKNNVYAVTSAGRIRKFSPDGAILWTWRSSQDEGKVVTSPFLYKGQLFISSMGPGSRGYSGLVHCFDMETGRRLWAAPVPTSGHVNHDSSTLHLAEGIVMGAMTSSARPAAYEGNNMIYAMNASDGSHLWEYTLERGVLWNFMPSTPGDGTFLFSSACGLVQRRRLGDGGLVWQGPVREPGVGCSTGGGTLGPNGVFYAETNHMAGPEDAQAPLPGLAACSPSGCQEGLGLLAAYRAEDGALLWSRRLWPHLFGFQYPAVGEVSGRLAVVAAVGINPGLPAYLRGERWLPTVVRYLVARLQPRWAWLRWLLGAGVKHNGVAALDAQTGKEIWLWEEEPWTHLAAAGDEETFHERAHRSLEDPRMEAGCGPDNWAIPAITADGTVLVGSGSTGNLYAIRDANGDGSIQKSEVSTFQTGNAFLNGPALAPGFMAVAPCWGKMYVFKGNVQ